MFPNRSNLLLLRKIWVEVQLPFGRARVLPIGEYLCGDRYGAPPPRLRLADTNAACISDVEPSSSNTCSYPVSYHLTIDDVAFAHQMTSLDDYLFTPKFLTTQSLALTRQYRKRLGPGKPSFVMVLANNVWTLVLSNEFQCSF